MSYKVIAKTDLGMDESKEKILPLSDPKSRFLLAREGIEIPYAEAMRLGLITMKVTNSSEDLVELQEIAAKPFWVGGVVPTAKAETVVPATEVAKPKK